MSDGGAFFLGFFLTLLLTVLLAPALDGSDTRATMRHLLVIGMPCLQILAIVIAMVALVYGGMPGAYGVAAGLSTLALLIAVICTSYYLRTH